MGRPKILIVDDAPDNLEVLYHALKDEADVLGETSGKEALRTVRSSHPDLVLLDIMMSEMDGYDVCAELKNDADTSHIPIIYITARTDAKSETRALSAGGADFISKPFNVEVVRARVRLQLELAQHRRRLEDLVQARTRELVVARDAAEAANQARSAVLATLKQAEELVCRYELLAARSRDALLFIRRDDGRILEANESAGNHYGYTREEMLTLTVLDLRAPAVRKQMPEEMNQAAAGGILFETLHQRRDGSTFPVEVSSQGVDSEGVSCLVSVIRDITERKISEKALQKSQELLDETQRLTRLGGWEWDVAAETMTWTDETYRIHGFEPEAVMPGSSEHIARSLACYDPEDRSKIATAFRRCVEEGQPYDLEFPFTSVDGQRLWIRTVAKAKFESGRVVKVVGNIMDVTGRKQMQLAVEKSEQRYRLLFENGMDANLLIVPDARISAANPAACRMFGRTEAEMKQIGWNGIVDASDPRLGPALEKRARDGYFVGELTFVRSDGTTFPGEISSVILQEPGRDMTSTIIHDVTQRKELEQTLRHAKDELHLKVRQLNEKRASLEEVNAALRVLLKQREEDRRELAESVISNVRTLILPYLQELRKAQLRSRETTLVEILESHMHAITSTFNRELGLKGANLTPTQMRIAAFVRDGRSTAEIAEILCLSEKTIEVHRANIRKRLGLQGSRSNLRSHLLSLK